MTLPLSVILYSYGCPPYIIIIANIILSICQLGWQMRMLVKLTNFNVSGYFTNTIRPVLKVSLLILPLLGLTYIYSHSILEILSIGIITTIYILFVIYCFGLERYEKVLITEIIHKIIKK